jgi:hypothetical protein
MSKNFLIKSLGVIACILILVVKMVIASPDYLYLSSDRLYELRQMVYIEGTHEQAAFDSMKARVDNPDILAAYPTGGGGKYEPGYRAREAAMISLLMRDKADAEHYADLACQMANDAIKGDLDQSHNQPGELVNMAEGYGLARAMIGLNVAITYNWMQDAWDRKQRAAVKEAIDDALEAWLSYEHPNLLNDRASNWVSVCRGAELVMILASGDAELRAERVEFLKDELLWHMDSGFGSLGVAQEGAGYTEYPGQFLLPAVYAMAELGDFDLMEKARKIEWWKLVMYAYTLQPQKHATGDRKFLQWGVAERGPHEGWLSLLLNLVPQEQLPYYLWFYDHYLGRKAQLLSEGYGYDFHRGGTTWSLIYYPMHVPAVNPTGVFPKVVKDSHGFAFFRNRWQDGNDIQVMAAADEVSHSHAWDQTDNLALRLMAFNAGFINGPAKSREQSDFSGLLVDGVLAPKGIRATRMNGATIAFESNSDGGIFIADGGELYRALGVDSATRQTEVAFSSVKSNTAIISTMDQVRSQSVHDYTWQANLRMPNVENGLPVMIREEEGVSTFLIEGGNGYVKGWVLHPQNVAIDAEDSLQITTHSADADIWIVMVATQEKPLEAEIEGNGLKRTFTYGGQTVRFNADVERIRID